ncbi:MAG: GlsB/YeaQ/YmgE family stress response membrane protein [Thermoguttaceae bacterium]
MTYLIYFLLIGLAAGWLAGKIMTGQSFSLVGNLAVGVIGAVLGGFVFRLVGLSATGLFGSLICATAGAILLLFLLQKFGKRP